MTYEATKWTPLTGEGGPTGKALPSLQQLFGIKDEKPAVQAAPSLVVVNPGLPTQQVVHTFLGQDLNHTSSDAAYGGGAWKPSNGLKFSNYSPDYARTVTIENYERAEAGFPTLAPKLW